MSLTLYCKNTAVFDIENEKILNENLVPGRIKIDPTKEGYEEWLKKRYSSGTNTLARMLKGKIFGQGKRLLYDKETHILSFSDCYWAKDSNELLKFEDISPYYTAFFTGEKEYNGEAIPTLYTPGAKAKEWKVNGNLYKENSDIELEAYEVCKAANISCNEIIKSGTGIECKNITSSDIMLEQLDMSGRVTEDKYTEKDILNIFGQDAVKLYTIDAILGNGDRHSGNIAFKRDSNTGEYLGMSPLYDFDHTGDDSKEIINKYLLDYLKYINKEDISLVVDICQNVIASENVKEIYKLRSEYLLKTIEKDIKPLSQQMEQVWEDFFNKPKDERISIEWKGKNYRIAEFEDMYLAQCKKDGIEPNNDIKDHFWKNCVDRQGYEPKFCKEANVLR